MVKRLRLQTFELLSTALLLALLFHFPVYASRWTTLRPDGGKKTTILINGKPRTYYRLSPGKSLTLPIEEPGLYRVITRLDYGEKKGSEKTYTFRIGLDDEKGTLYSRATKPDKKCKIKKRSGVVGKSRIIELDVPDGVNNMTVRLGSKAKNTVFFRLQKEREEYTDQARYIAITPASYKQSVGVATREVISNYYLIDKEGLLTCEVIGPTTLKVLVRVKMDDTMRGEIKLPVAVYEDGTLKNTYFMAVKASQLSVMPDYPDLIPSRGENFFIEVPRGQHRYTFSLPENGHEVLLRFFIPEKHLANSAK